MTQTTPERKQCSVCPGEYTVTAAGMIRHHTTDNPEFQADPTPHTSNKCKGAGELPAGAAQATSADGPQCRLCKHPVVLTGNGRARSHLTPEATPRPCPAGSDFPLGVYPDIIGTTDGTVATLARDCGHVPAGECYACYGVPVPGRVVGDGDGTEPKPEPRETITHTGTNVAVVAAAPWGVDPAAVAQPTMADQFKAAPLTGLLERGTAGVGTVLDVMDGDMRAEAERFMAAAIPEQPTATVEHPYIDASGVAWVHPGPEATCRAPECSTARYQRSLPEGFDPKCEQCDTDTHRCKGCGESVKHGLDDVCTDCDRRVSVNRLPKGETEDGRPCDHSDGLFGVEDDRLVCVACGTPCTHPHGFQDTADDLDEDGQDRVVSTCAICGAMDPEDDDSQDPQAGGVDATIEALEAEQAAADGWRTPADTVRDLMPEDVQGLDALRLNCATCGHLVTPLVEAFDLYGKAKAVLWVCELAQHAGALSCDKGGHECVPNRNVRLGDLDEGDYFVRNGTLMRLTERESSSSVLAEVMAGPHKGRTGELRNPDEVVERAPAPQAVDPHAYEADVAIATVEAEQAEEDRQYHQTINEELARQREKAEAGPVLLGHLEEGDHFTRRGVVMRVTGETNGVVHAVVVEGPMQGRTGDLTNLGETVERTHCRHEWITETGPEGGENPGPGCPHCGTFKAFTEQETKECTDDRTATRRPGSSAAPTSPTKAPAPGSPRATPASAPTVLPESNPVTSSGPTAKAAGRGGSAAVTTDQDAAARFLGGGRPAATQATGARSQADAAAQFLAGGSGAHGEKETKRDRYGRYLIPHPDTGKEKAWTRSTTFAKSISDTYALSQWGLRMCLLGATMRPDIVQRAHGKHVREDKKLLDELTAELKSAAGDKVAANLGTSMHSFTEMADRAWHSPGGPRSIMDQVPPDCRDMVETYIRLLEETGLEPVPHLIEFTTVVKQYGVAGTSDNCYKVTKPLTLKIGRTEVRFNPGDYVIGDKKTGRDLDYGWQEIAIQLGTYAQGINTAGVWDRQNEVWVPDPLNGAKVRTDAGIVIHLPVDPESEKTPTVYGLDLESGWNAAVLCERVRAWRNARNLASPVTVSEAETFAPARPEPAVASRTTVRPASLKDRANAVTSKGAASAVWQAAKAEGLPDSEVDELVSLMQARLAKLSEPGG